MKTDHNAIIAYIGQQLLPLSKMRQRRVFRQRSPAYHPRFLECLSQVNIDLSGDATTQTNFDAMLTIMHELLGEIYPEREITDVI